LEPFQRLSVPTEWPEYAKSAAISPVLNGEDASVGRRLTASDGKLAGSPAGRRLFLGGFTKSQSVFFVFFDIFM